MFKGILDSLEAIIEQGKKEGEIRHDLDSGAAAFEIMALGEGAILLWSINPNIEREALMEKIAENYWRSITADIS